MREMKVGDWIVIRGNFLPEIRQIVKLTERMVVASRTDSWERWRWERWRSVRRTAILYAGTEQGARRLQEYLVSSEALYTTEHKAALARKHQRQEKLVAEAEAAT